MRSLFLAWLSFSLSMTVLQITQNISPQTLEGAEIHRNRYALMNCHEPPASQRVAAECTFGGYYPLEPVTEL